MKALEKDRVRRYDTANGLARDIQRYLDGDPVEAGPPSATYRLRKFARKYRQGCSRPRAPRPVDHSDRGRCVAMGSSGAGRAHAERRSASAIPTEEAPERRRDPGLEPIPQTIPVNAVMDTAEVVKRLKEATVYVKNKIGDKTFSSGTGFVIEASGRRRVDRDQPARGDPRHLAYSAQASSERQQALARGGDSQRAWRSKRASPARRHRRTRPLFG